MPIPDFDGITNALPPHLGSPIQRADLSPFLCTTEELCQRFAKSPERRQILAGLLRLRAELCLLGLQGFQWLDGSFLEDTELLQSRAPNDIDVVTFIAQPTDLQLLNTKLQSKPDLYHMNVKQNYLVDHFLVPLCSEPELVVENTRYWYGVFSHRRDCTWKGMLRIELIAKADDDAAWNVLGNNP